MAKTWCRLLALAALAVAPRGWAEAAPPVLVLLSQDMPPGFDEPQLLEAHALYLEGLTLRYARMGAAPDDPQAFDAFIKQQAAQGAHRVVAWFSWSPLPRRFLVHVTRVDLPEAELLVGTMECPETLDANFYRQVALKLRTLVRVAERLPGAKAREQAKARRARRAAEAEPPDLSGPSPWRWRPSLGLGSTTALTLDTMAPQLGVGGSVGVDLPWGGAGLALSRSLPDRRLSKEGQGDATLTQLAAVARYRALSGLLLQGAFLDGAAGLGLTWLEVGGQLRGGEERRTVSLWIPTARVGLLAGYRVSSFLELSLGPSLDVFIIDSKVLLTKTHIYDSGYLLPRFDLGLRAIL